MQAFYSIITIIFLELNGPYDYTDSGPACQRMEDLSEGLTKRDEGIFPKWIEKRVFQLKFAVVDLYKNTAIFQTTEKYITILLLWKMKDDQIKYFFQGNNKVMI